MANIRNGCLSGKTANEIYSEFFGTEVRVDGHDIPLQANDRFYQQHFIVEASGSSTVKKQPAIERMLSCSLEDLYKGTIKKMKISREVVDSSTGRLKVVEEILPIEIKRGWKKGTRITFPGKGNEQGGGWPSDLVFVIDEKPHSVFGRDGNDLILNQNVSLVDALTGYRGQITTLDGRVLNIVLDSVIGPGCEEVVKGEGMPIQREVLKKGDLRIKFNVKFPNMLTGQEKSLIRRAIPSSRFL